MTKTQSPPSLVRMTFAIHALVAVVIGVFLLLIPQTFGSWFGYPACPGVEPPLRAFGALMLGFGALTSSYGVMARTWEQVDYIVRGEITFLVLQTIVFIVSAIAGNGPLLGNALFGVVSLGLLVLFVAAWRARPK